MVWDLVAAGVILWFLWKIVLPGGVAVITFCALLRAAAREAWEPDVEKPRSTYLCGCGGHGELYDAHGPRCPDCHLYEGPGSAFPRTSE